MKQILRIFNYFCLWVLLFWFAKAFFLIANYDQASRLSARELAGIYGHGLKMDVSTACYVLLLPCLLLVARFLLSARFVNRFVWIYTLVIAGVASFLLVLDAGLYPHWGTRVNVTVFNYIDDPVAMRASVSLFAVVAGLLIAGSSTAGFLVLYKRTIPGGVAVAGPVSWRTAPLRLLLVATLIIPIRGGLDTVPLNLSSVAFSHSLFVNQAATNYVWNFFKSVQRRKWLTNPCAYLPREESIRIFGEYMKNNTLVQRPELVKLNPGKPPNVILIILESFSNKVITPLGGSHAIAPNLDALCANSTLFTSFYATGNRSDRGISAVLGGYPSLLSTSIMLHPEKSRSLTLLPEYFIRHNYQTSFYFGGDINFYNLKTFLLQGNYGRLITKADFPSGLGRMSRWGVPDGYVFERALADLKTEKSPFFLTLYAISSHPPYDVPYAKIPGDSLEAKYLNSIAYTDSILGGFIEGLKKSPLWENTLVIVTSDHGSLQPGPTDNTDPASYRIPLIWSGGVIDSPQRIEAITMQADFPTLLVHQLGWETDYSRFSKDFHTLHPFAFFMLDAGWGYVVPEGSFYFDREANTFVSKPPPKGTTVDLSFPKAYLQVLHDDFLSR